MALEIEETLAVMLALEKEAHEHLREFLYADMEHALIQFIGRSSRAPDPGAAILSLERAISAVQTQSIDAGISTASRLIPASKSLTRELANLYRATYSHRSASSINKTTYQTIRAMLLRRQAQGMSFEQAAREVSALIPGLSDTRALLISRTETHSAMQFASQQAAYRSGLMLRKHWNTVQDEKIRDFNNGLFSHRAMHGSIVPIDGTFSVPRRGGGFEAILFPGDPEGSAGNIIHCRCIQTYEKAAA